MKTAISFKELSKVYGETAIINNLNLRIEQGDFMVIYGLPSCGKSVLLRLLMGIEKPTSGNIFLRGKDSTHLSAGERNIGYVPQSFALFPNLTVYDNIAYPLKLMKDFDDKIDNAVKDIADMLNISDLLIKYPDKLSGGQKQRVAIARGLIKYTDIFVLDDPLVGLDFKLREKLINDLKNLQEKHDFTFIYTTSESQEALTLGKHTAILNQGKIIEVGLTDKLYKNPSKLKTMEILGFPGANNIKGKYYIKNGKNICETNLFKIYLDTNLNDFRLDTTSEVRVCIRPEYIYIDNHKHIEDVIKITGNIFMCEDLGGEEIIYFDINGIILTSVRQHQHNTGLSEDKVQDIYIKTSNIFVYDKKTGDLIGKGDAVISVEN